MLDYIDALSQFHWHWSRRPGLETECLAVAGHVPGFRLGRKLTTTHELRHDMSKWASAIVIIDLDIA